MSEQITKDFISNYRQILIEDDSRDKKKKFNRHLANYKYILVHPFKETDDSPLQIIMGFTNELAIYPAGREHIRHVFGAAHNIYESFTFKDPDISISQTFSFETASVEPIPVEIIPWSKLIEAPKLDDGDFELLQESFMEFFSLKDYEHDHDFNAYFFKEENKPEELELREVWQDVDKYDKFGNITTLVFWKKEFIGWVSVGGRYFDTTCASTVNVEKWKELMNTIYDKTGFVRTPKMNGVSIHNMNTENVDDLLNIPGVDEYSYKSED